MLKGEEQHKCLSSRVLHNMRCDHFFFFLCSGRQISSDFGFSLVTLFSRFLFFGCCGCCCDRSAFRWRKSALKRTLKNDLKFQSYNRRQVFTQFLPNGPIRRTLQKDIENERWSLCRPYQSQFSFGSGAARNWPWLFGKHACRLVWQHCDSMTLNRCSQPPIFKKIMIYFENKKMKWIYV